MTIKFILFQQKNCIFASYIILMKLSIIIVNYNVVHFLEQCLQSVMVATKDIDAEIFVVDNNSIDLSVEMVREKFPQVKVIANNSNLGFAKANNIAIRQSQGEYVLLLNPDTVVEADTFSKTITFMDQHPDAGGLGVKMVDGKGVFLPESKRSLPIPSVAFYKIFGLAKIFKKSKRFGKYHLTYLDENEINEVEVLSGAFMLLRKTTLDKVGLLDEDYFMYGEDIDLSYRITQGGYKNYYFPKTRIIHYKGESTKKSSINYVIVFYQAMQIFAKKHFSHKNAAIFNTMINFAIWLRAAMAIVKRMFLRILVPMMDFLLIYAGLWSIAFYWQRQVLSLHSATFSNFYIYLILPLYALVWVLCIWGCNGYKKPVVWSRINQGVALGLVLILLVYALLSENFRFSRAVILLGACWTFAIINIFRYILAKINLKNYPIGEIHNRRVLIIGDEKEVYRVANILNLTITQNEFIGFVYYLNQPKPNADFVGNISQLRDIVNIYQIGEIIFCSKNFTAKDIITLMEDWQSYNLEYKIAPEETSFIIGANSVNIANKNYFVDVNAIGKLENRRKKRLVDIICSISLLITGIVTCWLADNKGKYFCNLWACLSGKKTFVGYTPVNEEALSTLPKLKPSILYTVDDINLEIYDQDIIMQLNNLYARNYSVWRDIQIIIHAFKHLGK